MFFGPYSCPFLLKIEFCIHKLSVFLQVRCGDRHQLVPDNPERFDRVVCVLGREAISSGRHYWEVRGSLLWVSDIENNKYLNACPSSLLYVSVFDCINMSYFQVEVGGKTDWDLGVARQSINRKGKIEVTPSNGYWFLSLRDKWVISSLSKIEDILIK